MSEHETVLSETIAGVARVTLNRPEKLNTFNPETHAALLRALESAEGNPAVRVVVITGAGRGFCAGQDLSDRYVSASDAPVDLGYTLETFYKPLVTKISSLRVPVIAAVNGVAAGAGLSLALACDLVVATQSANFMMAFSKIGLIPDAGSTYFLPRALGTPLALGFALTGDKMPASQAQQLGLIWKCVPDDFFLAEVNQLAAQIAALPPLAMTQIKQVIRSAAQRDLPQSLMHEAGVQRTLGRSNDYREGVAAFMEKRVPQFTGS
jgi:2-(1,2-epoxy-1,2-dihydrophenyl)acetyl-CoA isomerase